MAPVLDLRCLDDENAFVGNLVSLDLTERSDETI
jgi:hypothetical protein